MTPARTKIGLIIATVLLLGSCNVVKKVPEGEFLLTKNTIVTDGEEVTEYGVNSQLYQEPNVRIPLVGLPLGIYIYNLADPRPDSTFGKWLHKKPKREQRLAKFISAKQVQALNNGYVNFNKWLERTGSVPVIVDVEKAERSAKRLEDYYASFGWFNARASYKITPSETKKKRARVEYSVTKYKPYFVDSIRTKIASAAVQKLYDETKNQSFVVAGKQFENNDFANERKRLAIQMRNSGLYHFDQEYVTFDADTVNTAHKANVTYIIPHRKVTQGDSTFTEPFKVHKISEVHVVTDHKYENRNRNFSDSAYFKGYKLLSYDKLKYRPKSITDAISITPDSIFRDIDRTLTYNQLSDLKVFKYPNISYAEDPRDTTGTSLIATILLSPRKTFTADFDFDTYTSAIQQIGIGFSAGLLTRNVFRGAETFQLSGRGSVGSSKDAGDAARFFNISEIGGDAKLSFPRILFPLGTDGIVRKYMSPSTNISLGASAQNNIGLDRQTINGVFNYEWEPTAIRTNRLDIFNVQYVRNLNTRNYFNVYRSTYSLLNDIALRSDFVFSDTSEDPMLGIPLEANTFINLVLNGEGNLNDPTDEGTVKSIAERRERLSEDNLIFASNFRWIRDTRESIFDQNFSRWRWKLESAGNILSTVSSIFNLKENENSTYEVMGVAFSQYIKAETEYIKHWFFGKDLILAIRAFGGIAVPYGNSSSIPFTRSYFAGGTNDNRGWRAYDLGPGSSGSSLEFNEANLKLAFNAEQRFPILGAFKGALFVDVGNIWNVLDNVNDDALTFNGIQDLNELAVATGFGLRYDFAFAVARFDVGFKTHNPGRPERERWFTQYNLANAVYNIGINYPF